MLAKLISFIYQYLTFLVNLPIFIEIPFKNQRIVAGVRWAGGIKCHFTLLVDYMSGFDYRLRRQIANYNLQFFGRLCFVGICDSQFYGIGVVFHKNVLDFRQIGPTDDRRIITEIPFI